MRTRQFLIIVLFLFFFLVVGLKPFLQWRFPLRFYDLILFYGAKTEIDPLLLAAVIQVESGFKPDAVSSKGAVGLMQIMPDTAFWLAEKEGFPLSREKLFQPECNLLLGTSYLQSLLEEFPTEEAALAAYNAGPSNVRRWLEKGLWDGSRPGIKGIPFPETRIYVQRVGVTKTFFRYIYQWELQD